MIATKYLIIGSGITGLTLARDLKEECIIIEKDSRPGGLCKSFYFGDFIWDYAGHFFHFKDKKTKEYFKSVLDEENCLNHEKRTFIYYDEKLIDYPFQKNIHQLNKQEFIDCLYDLYFKEEKDDYSSFKDMLIGKFGNSICNKFLIPYNEKLYACDLNSLDKDAMGRFFPYANLAEILKNMKTSRSDSYNDTFIYPKDGAEAVINHLLNDININDLHLNEKVIDLNINEKIVKTNKNCYKYDYLINTIPFNRFLELCDRKINVKEFLSWNKVLVFNIGFDKPSINDSVHWIYFPQQDYNFYRIGFYNNILKQEKLSIYVEIGLKPDEDFDEEIEFYNTVKNLKKCGIIDDHKVVAKQVLLMNPAYVHISSEGKKFVDQNLIELKRKDVYSIGRYGGWKYCSMEDCFIEASKLAKTLKNE